MLVRLPMDQTDILNNDMGAHRGWLLYVEA